MAHPGQSGSEPAVHSGANTMITLCVSLLTFVIGWLVGIAFGFKSVTKDIERYGFFTWHGVKYDVTIAPTKRRDR